MRLSFPGDSSVPYTQLPEIHWTATPERPLAPRRGRPRARNAGAAGGTTGAWAGPAAGAESRQGRGSAVPVSAVLLAPGMEPPTGTESARLVSPRGGRADGSLRLKRYRRHRQSSPRHPSPAPIAQTSHHPGTPATASTTPSPAPPAPTALPSPALPSPAPPTLQSPPWHFHQHRHTIVPTIPLPALALPLHTSAPPLPWHHHPRHPITSPGPRQFLAPPPPLSPASATLGPPAPALLAPSRTHRPQLLRHPQAPGTSRSAQLPPPPRHRHPRHVPSRPPPCLHPSERTSAPPQSPSQP